MAVEFLLHFEMYGGFTEDCGEGAGGSGNSKSRVEWAPENTNLFIDLMYGEFKNRCLLSGNFDTVVWNRIASRMKHECPIQSLVPFTDKACKGKLKRLKDVWKRFYKLKELQTGWGIDADTGRLQGNWGDHLLSYPEDRDLIDCAFPCYNEFKEMFGTSIAHGSFATFTGMKYNRVGVIDLDSGPSSGQHASQARPTSTRGSGQTSSSKRTRSMMDAQLQDLVDDAAAITSKKAKQMEEGDADKKLLYSELKRLRPGIASTERYIKGSEILAHDKDTRSTWLHLWEDFERVAWFEFF